MNVYIKKQQYFWRKAIAVMVSIALLIITLNATQLFVRNTFHALSAPFSRVFSNAASATFSTFNSFFTFRSIARENSNLQQENQRLLNQVALLQSQIQQSQTFQAAHAATKNDGFKLAMVNVIGVNPNQQTVTIDQGSANGLRENMPIISSEKAVFGKIAKVYDHFSEVMLISAEKSVVDVKIQHSDSTIPSINGVLKGDGNFGVYMDLVSTDDQINTDDVLITSGLEGVFPRDLLVGKITSTDKNDVKAFQSAKVQPLFNVKNTLALFVITDYKK